MLRSMLSDVSARSQKGEMRCSAPGEAYRSLRSDAAKLSARPPPEQSPVMTTLVRLSSSFDRAE